MAQTRAKKKIVLRISRHRGRARHGERALRQPSPQRRSRWTLSFNTWLHSKRQPAARRTSATAGSNRGTPSARVDGVIPRLRLPPSERHVQELRRAFLRSVPAPIVFRGRRRTGMPSKLLDGGDVRAGIEHIADEGPPHVMRAERGDLRPPREPTSQSGDGAVGHPRANDDPALRHREEQRTGIFAPERESTAKSPSSRKVTRPVNGASAMASEPKNISPLP